MTPSDWVKWKATPAAKWGPGRAEELAADWTLKDLPALLDERDKQRKQAQAWLEQAKSNRETKEGKVKLVEVAQFSGLKAQSLNELAMGIPAVAEAIQGMMPKEAESKMDELAGRKQQPAPAPAPETKPAKTATKPPVSAPTKPQETETVGQLLWKLKEKAKGRIVDDRVLQQIEELERQGVKPEPPTKATAPAADVGKAEELAKQHEASAAGFDSPSKTKLRQQIGEAIDPRLRLGDKEEVGRAFLALHKGDATAEQFNKLLNERQRSLGLPESTIKGGVVFRPKGVITGPSIRPRATVQAPRPPATTAKVPAGSSKGATSRIARLRAMIDRLDKRADRIRERYETVSDIDEEEQAGLILERLEKRKAMLSDQLRQAEAMEVFRLKGGTLHVFHGGPVGALSSNWPKHFTISQGRAEAYTATHKAKGEKTEVVEGDVTSAKPYFTEKNLSAEEVEKLLKTYDSIVVGKPTNPLDIIVKDPTQFTRSGPSVEKPIETAPA